MLWHNPDKPSKSIIDFLGDIIHIQYFRCLIFLRQLSEPCSLNWILEMQHILFETSEADQYIPRNNIIGIPQSSICPKYFVRTIPSNRISRFQRNFTYTTD